MPYLLLWLSAFRSAARCVRICSICSRFSELAPEAGLLEPVVPAVPDDPFRIASIASMWLMASD